MGHTQDLGDMTKGLVLEVTNSSIFISLLGFQGGVGQTILEEIPLEIH